MTALFKVTMRVRLSPYKIIDKCCEIYCFDAGDTCVVFLCTGCFQPFWILNWDVVRPVTFLNWLQR